MRQRLDHHGAFFGDGSADRHLFGEIAK
jgi:hypothetical protein